MKAKVFTIDGEVKGEVNLPKCFEEKIRVDIIQKAFRSISTRQSHGSYILAGKEVSASGKLRHARRAYKTLYGFGMSRVPRKTFTRRGTRFTRAGAFIPGTRGGRVAHPPKVTKIWVGAVNKKEKKKAFNSLLAATASEKELKKFYPNIDFPKLNLPLIIEDKITAINKTKLLRAHLKKILGFDKLLKKGRLLLVTEKVPKIEHSFLETVKAEELNIQTLAPRGKPGRMVIYTEGALEKLRKR